MVLNKKKYTWNTIFLFILVYTRPTWTIPVRPCPGPPFSMRGLGMMFLRTHSHTIEFAELCRSPHDVFTKVNIYYSGAFVFSAYHTHYLLRKVQLDNMILFTE